VPPQILQILPPPSRGRAGERGEDPTSSTPSPLEGEGRGEGGRPHLKYSLPPRGGGQGRGGKTPPQSSCQPKVGCGYGSGGSSQVPAARVLASRSTRTSSTTGRSARMAVSSCSARSEGRSTVWPSAPIARAMAA